MAGGGDKLCNYLADVKQTVRVEVIANKVSLPLLGYGLLTKTYSNLFYGANYDATDCEDKSFCWMQKMCPTEHMDMPHHAVCAWTVSEVYLREIDM